jgi:hypothetical protein
VSSSISRALGGFIRLAVTSYFCLFVDRLLKKVVFLCNWGNLGYLKPWSVRESQSRTNDMRISTELLVSVSPVDHSRINQSPADPFLKKGSVRSVSKPIPTRTNGKRQAQIKNPLLFNIAILVKNKAKIFI